MGGTSPIMLTPLAQRPTKNLRLIVTVFLDGSTSDCCFLARWPWELTLSSPGLLIRACSRALLAGQPHQRSSSQHSVTCTPHWSAWMREAFHSPMNEQREPDEPTYRNKNWSISSSHQKQGYTEEDATTTPPPSILKSLLSQYCTQWKYKGSPRSHETLQVIRLRQWSKWGSF